MYVQAKELFSSTLPCIYLDCLIPIPNFLAIKILRFTPESPALLLIPRNQYIIHIIDELKCKINQY